MSEVITTYKGTDKDMKCHGGFQYEIGKTYTDDGAIRCGNKGFHSCEAPLDVFTYFGPANGNRFFVAEADGEISKGSDDSKIASSKLALKAEIGIAGLATAQLKYVENICKNAPERVAQGDCGHAAAQGNSGHAAAQGDSGHAEVHGKNAIAAAFGVDGKARAPVGSAIMLAEYDEGCNLVAICAQIIDGEILKPDTWYTLKNGIIVECKEENE